MLLHAATVLLLFLVLRRMTGRFWPSALVAALFAVHPLRVESVAWVAERKDVLSGLFFMLDAGAYVGYVRRPFSLARYLAVMVFFALGLVAKPMLVTLPLVLLLLDYWPLGRLLPDRASSETPHRPFPLPLLPLLEKVPLLLIVVLSCGLTLWGQGQVRALIGHTPLSYRIGNSLLSYLVYLRQFFWPVGLAVVYPRGPALGFGPVVGAAWFSWASRPRCWCGGGGAPICSPAGCGTWGCSCPSSGSCSSARREWPTATPM